MKNFINLKDISKTDLRKIINDAKKRKVLRKKLNHLDIDRTAPLKGKLLIQMFEKSSLRTRLSFYLAIKQLGGTALTLRPDELHFGRGSEPISDTAKILGTYADLFMLRTDSEKKLELFKKNLDIPLINGLSPNSHPAQILSDIFTIEEIKKKMVSKLNICWIGDSNNVLNSLVEASIKFSFNLKIACPKEYMPKKKLMEWVKKNNGKVYLFNNPLSVIKNSDVLLTDKVISMNDRVNKSYKIKKFKKFEINDDILKYAKKDLIILHCLPRGDEITENVFNSVRSKVWTQASNRVHVQKSILLYCLNKLR